MTHISLTDEQRRNWDIWEDRSRYGKFLEWLAKEKQVTPCMDHGRLATEYALTINRKEKD